ncbi:MAG: hypothetical protein JJE51_08980 [Thermoanaerobaculia bacterium]|nr:hypothetical protein [Thermoanaerobaculia bacterium]
MTAKLRKHWPALAGLAAFHFVFFFPTLFMGRVVSPNDIYYNYQPWATYRPPSIVRVQNAVMSDPATGYLPAMSLLKNGWDAFHWDPYIGSGAPGFGSAGSAVLSPFVFFPTLLVPLSWVYTAIILLKINVAFWFAYAWLREERLGRRGAAIGALVMACAGAYSVRYLWQMTNATALYPALLWIVRRMFSNRRVPVWAIALIALAYALAGFPSTMAYGAYLAAAYALFLAIRERRMPWRRVGEALAGTAIGLLIASPALVPFVQFIRRSGYLTLRENLATIHFPLSHLQSFIDPQRLGNPALKNWVGDMSLAIANNYFEATIYVGLLTLPLALLALIRMQRHKWFWVGAAIMILLCMFGAPLISHAAARLPGIRYTSLTRLSLLLPIPMGFLAGSGGVLLLRWLRRWRWASGAAAIAVIVILAGDLGVVAGTFHPYLEPRHTDIPSTPVIDYLRADTQPFRFIAFLTYLWPNASQLYGIEDVSSHFASEADYRRVLARIDPGAWTGVSTVIQFSSLSFKFTDPLVSMLGVRYLLEHRNIDIIKWTTFGATVPGAKESGAFILSPATVARRTITVGAEPFWAIELPVSVERVTGASPRLEAELQKNGSVVWSRSFTTSDITAMNKVYVPVRPYARQGESVVLRIWTTGMRVGLLKSEAAAGNESPIYFGRVTIPIVFDREFPDGRVFRNLAEVPRFHAVKNVRKMNAGEMLATPEIDFGDEAVITDDPIFPPAGLSNDGRVDLVSYAPAEQRLTTTSSGALFLASSEKLTPELAITIDGKPAQPIGINVLFAGVVVPAGKHEVIFSRRVGRGWWPVSAFAAFALLVVGAGEITRALRRR